MLFCCSLACVCRCFDRAEHRVSPACEPRSLRSGPLFCPEAPRNIKSLAPSEENTRNSEIIAILPNIHTFSLFLSTTRGGVSSFRICGASSESTVCCCRTVFFTARVIGLMCSETKHSNKESADLLTQKLQQSLWSVP